MIVKGSIDLSALPSLQPAQSSTRLIPTFFQGSTQGGGAVGVVSSDQPEDILPTEQSPFDHINAFAQGSTAGESVLSLTKADVIHFGDPLIERISLNPALDQTRMDGGFGEKLLDEPNKQILKTLSMDFNADGLIDLIPVFTDGTASLLKQYGDKKYESRGDIALLADGIKDAFIIDSAGDGYPDLMIRTQSDRLKIYSNRR
jgi:hypothetical protein